MLSILFVLLLIAITGRMASLAIRMTWGISKIFLRVILFPLLMLGLAFYGLIYLILPILIVIGIISLSSSAA